MRWFRRKHRHELMPIGPSEMEASMGGVPVPGVHVACRVCGQKISGSWFGYTEWPHLADVRSYGECPGPTPS